MRNEIRTKFENNLNKNKEEFTTEINPSISDILRALKSITLHEGEDTYTINKSKTYVCLTDENGEEYDTHTLIYVILHELAHVLCDEIGHTEKFYKIFNNILDKDVDCDLHDKSIHIPTNYAKLDGSCGVSGEVKKRHNYEKTLN